MSVYSQYTKESIIKDMGPIYEVFGRFPEIDAVHSKALKAAKSSMEWTNKFKPCRQEIIDSGATTWPRSCPRCGITGKCTKEEFDPLITALDMAKEIKEHNKMNFNIITKATINLQAIRDIIAEAVEKQTGMKVDTITFNITKQYDMRNEPYSESLSSAEITFKQT